MENKTGAREAEDSAEISKQPQFKTRKCITPKIRNQLIQKFRVCQHRDADAQKICGSSFLLQVDHRQPQWAGGNHQEENLTVLCAIHNQAKYKKEAHINSK